MIDQKDPKSVGYTHARLLQTVVKKLIEQNRFKQVTIRNTCSWLHHSCHHLTLLALRFHLPTCGHHDSLSLAKPIAVPSTPQISCSDLLACGRTSANQNGLLVTLSQTQTHIGHSDTKSAFWFARMHFDFNIYASFHIKKCRYMKMLSLHFQLMPTASLPGVHMIATHTHTYGLSTHRSMMMVMMMMMMMMMMMINDDQWWSMMINDDQWWSMMINDDDHDDVNGGDDPNLKSSLDTNTSSCTQIRHGWWKCKLQGPSWCISLKCEPFFFTCLHQFESTYSKECGTVWNS